MKYEKKSSEWKNKRVREHEDGEDKLPYMIGGERSSFQRQGAEYWKERLVKNVCCDKVTHKM